MADGLPKRRHVEHADLIRLADVHERLGEVERVDGSQTTHDRMTWNTIGDARTDPSIVLP
jgi:hypothetical protein